MRNNVEIVRASYEASARADAHGAVADFAADMEWVDLAGAGTSVLHGPEEVMRNVFARLGTDWDNHRAEPDRYIDGGQFVVTLGRYSGTFKPTGRVLDQRFVHVWTLAEGKIVRYEGFTNTMSINEITKGTTPS